MNEAESLCVRMDDECDVGPVPASVPGDFTVRLGDVMAGRVLVEMQEEFGKFGGAAGAASGFLSMMHWVEAEVRGFPDLLEGLGRLKGAVMAVGAVMENLITPPISKE